MKRFSRRRVLAAGGLAAVVGASPARAAAGVPRGLALRDLATPRPAFAVAFAQGAASTGWLPLEAGDSLVLQGRVNGAPTRMILDSGAEASLVDLALARRLGLRARGRLTVDDGLGLSSPGVELADVDVSLGALRLSDLHALAVDLSGLAAAGPPVPVILGREAFERLLVEIDVAAGRIAFHTPAARPPLSNARAAPLTRERDGTRTLPITVEGTKDIPARFDLGSQSPLVASEAFAQAHGWLSGRPTSTWIGASVAGVTPERTATVKGLSLAGFALPACPLETVAAWGSPGSPLIVGLPLLSRLRLTSDYAHDRLWLAPAADALQAPFRRNRSGLACRVEGMRLEVLHVARSSPAAAGGWRVGEAIAAIDGRPAAEASGFGSGDAGRTYVLALDTGRTRRLTLADYF